MDNTIITPLGAIRPRAFMEKDRAMARINRVAMAIFFYMVLVIYPAYGTLRSMWSTDHQIVTLEGVVTILVVSFLFALFARRSIKNRLIDQVESENR